LAAVAVKAQLRIALAVFATALVAAVVALAAATKQMMQGRAAGLVTTATAAIHPMVAAQQALILTKSTKPAVRTVIGREVVAAGSTLLLAGAFQPRLAVAVAVATRALCGAAARSPIRQSRSSLVLVAVAGVPLAQMAASELIGGKRAWR
jgi:hypothetical protein